MLKEHDEMNKEIKKSKDLNSSSRILVYLKNNVIIISEVLEKY